MGENVVLLPRFKSWFFYFPLMKMHVIDRIELKMVPLIKNSLNVIHYKVFFSLYYQQKVSSLGKQ